MNKTKLFLIFFSGLLAVQPTTWCKTDNQTKLIKVSLTLSGLKIQAFGLSKEIAAFEPENTKKIDKWLENTNKVLDWIEEKHLVENLIWLVPAKKQKEFCSFLEKQKQEIKKSHKKLCFGICFGKIAKWLPFIGGCTFVSMPLFKSRFSKNGISYARLSILPVAILAGYGVEKYLKTRLTLAQRLSDIEKKIENLIERIEKANKKFQATSLLNPIKKRVEEKATKLLQGLFSEK